MNNLSQSTPASILYLQPTDATSAGPQASAGHEFTLVGKAWAIAFTLFTLAALILLVGNTVLYMQQCLAGYTFVDFLRCFQDISGPEASMRF